MLDAPPQESEKRSWLYVAGGILLIYLTIPIARALRETVDSQIGREAFLYLAAILGLFVAWAAIKNLSRRHQPASAYVCLFGVFAFLGWKLYELRGIPEEALHLAEYGLLSVLVYRALVHRIRDYSIYFAATIVVAVVGIVDEYIQWLVPSRYFDWRDITTNFLAGSMAQLAIFSGLRPSIVKNRPKAASLSILCYLAAGTLILLTIGLHNTHQRLAWYASKHPALHFLLENDSMMAEYGYLYDEENTGLFRSRFSRDELEKLNIERGAEVAEALDIYIADDLYRPFLKIYSVALDPYAHEAGVHLFRREYYFKKTLASTENLAKNYRIAHYENQILENYYGEALRQSTHLWTEETAAKVDKGADHSTPYESPVSSGVITHCTANQTLLMSLIGIFGLLLAGRRWQKLSRIQ